MFDDLPGYIYLIFFGLLFVLIPLFLVWLFKGVVQTFSGMFKCLAGGPGKACQRLGLTLVRKGALSGLAKGLFDGWSVQISWIVGHQHGYDPKWHTTSISAEIYPKLSLGLKAEEGDAKSSSVGLSEVEQYMTIDASNIDAAREVLRKVEPVLLSVLGGVGRILIDDNSVTVVLPGVGAGEAELKAALRRAVTVAKALSQKKS